MRPPKLTDWMRALFEEQAELRARVLRYKQLEKKTGLAHGYIANLIGRLARAKCELIIVSSKKESDDNRGS